MNTRRKFILQGSLATTAFLAAKPVSALAGLTSMTPSSGFHYNSITLLHTAGKGPALASAVKKISSRTASILLSHGDPAEQGMNVDASLTSIRDQNYHGYQVICKENIRVGVITATGDNTLQQVNQLSAMLKKEKNCRLVVCISQLGFKNKKGLDDRTLAEDSENLDLIMGKRDKNSSLYPYIARNKKKSEVILHYTDNQADALGKIRIGFDPQGNRYHLSF